MLDNLTNRFYSVFKNIRGVATLNEEEFIKKVYRASKEQQEKTSKLLKKRLAKEIKRIFSENKVDGNLV